MSEWTHSTIKSCKFSFLNNPILAEFKWSANEWWHHQAWRQNWGTFREHELIWEHDWRYVVRIGTNDSDLKQWRIIRRYKGKDCFISCINW